MIVSRAQWCVTSPREGAWNATQEQEPAGTHRCSSPCQWSYFLWTPSTLSQGPVLNGSLEPNDSCWLNDIYSKKARFAGNGLLGLLRMKLFCFSQSQDYLLQPKHHRCSSWCHMRYLGLENRFTGLKWCSLSPTPLKSLGFSCLSSLHQSSNSH